MLSFLVKKSVESSFELIIDMIFIQDLYTVGLHVCPSQPR